MEGEKEVEEREMVVTEAVMITERWQVVGTSTYLHIYTSMTKISGIGTSIGGWPGSAATYSTWAFYLGSGGNPDFTFEIVVVGVCTNFCEK